MRRRLARRALLTASTVAVVAAVLPAVASAHNGSLTITCTSATYSFDNASFGYTGDFQTQNVQETIYIDGTQVAQTTVPVNPLSPNPTSTNTVSISVPPGTHTVEADALNLVTGAEVAVPSPASGQTTTNGYFPVYQTLNCAPPPCPQGTKVNLRWHYSANGSSGSWSGTYGVTCPSSLTTHQQAMEGDFKLNPGTVLNVGYDFTVPGNNNPLLEVTVTNPTVTFEQVECASGATPSATSFSVTMPTTSYLVPDSQWYPTGQQSSLAAYEGSISVPNLCNGGQVRLQQGGIFTANVT